MRYGSVALAASVVAVLAVSLPAKMAQPGNPYVGGRERLEQRGRTFLAAHGYRFTDTIQLSIDGYYRALSFTGPTGEAGSGPPTEAGCTPSLVISAVPINGEVTSLLEVTFGDGGTIAYAYDGQLYDKPPVAKAYLREKLDRLLRLYGAAGGGAPANAFLAVIEDASCPSPTPLPWSEL